MRNLTEANLTDAVLAKLEGAPNPRFRQVMTSLLRHLHALGFYDVQRSNLNGMRLRGKFHTDTQGRCWFWTVKPTEYPIPTDGPVGQMLLNMGRHPYRPAHIHTIVSAPGYEPVTTHVFVEGDRYLDSDAVFGVKDSLVVDFVRHEPGIAPDGTPMERSYFTVQYDFGLKPATQS